MKKILLVVSGAASAMFAPFHINWATETSPGMDVKVLLSRAATRFVQPAALALVSRSEVLLDDWEEWDASRSTHVELSRWADAVVVCPASFNYVNSYTSGLADRPSLLILQMTHVPKVFAPSFPPGIEPDRWLNKLAQLPSTHFLKFADARSAGTGRHEGTANRSFLDALRLLSDIEEERISDAA
ncbi:flavoprotein [Rathayibacter iranicus]|uniref:Flavoprotein domain-containing protein n=2 Tax=Rathayibacter iranicus TaxID=59737 RepID=A0AAD1AET5_9MICO|nr:flavoprotein [Rathayibacter iranicus]AZZ56858.1 hypothetical protein C7V51_13995 [Rathayibacter iranicus]MWV32047.1 hypothetical protein [Rathayibacter iranicus NCPPB 2253 = VKM Ac-1602]PPI42537.1 hypothetical protein C5E09_12850 [Rathayibacter iranicus]PPI57999.1 hypothetical protein C5E08_13755 [Rathayibacter iranicus]PPI68910.1 hypothetical protein C5E01_12805 [Rathayibacter iranicus]